MNYGHPLQFGTFITPLNSSPETAVALARRSEALGYDLVTFQDHPYQGAFLDTWTLLAWVAGTAYSDTSTTLGGIYTYTVVAIDAAGNTSAASASVTLTR